MYFKFARALIYTIRCACLKIWAQQKKNATTIHTIKMLEMTTTTTTTMVMAMKIKRENKEKNYTAEYITE